MEEDTHPVHLQGERERETVVVVVASSWSIAWAR